MKRKLILTILMLMVGIALAGCDFFGNTTTTTTTQASETTTSTTNTTTSDTSTTTTTTTTDEPTTTTTTTTTEQPTTTTTTTTEQPTTATTTTTVTTTTTTTTGVTTTTTTVTTTTPTTTTTTTSISTTTSTGTTTTTSATTVTTTTTEESFDRQDLVDLFIEKSGEENPDETMIEAQIDFYMTLFGLTSEQDLYDLMIGLDTIMGGFDMIETLQDAKDWYAQAKALGFDKTIVTNVMVNMLRQQVNDAVDRYDEAYYVNEIAQLNAEILNVQGQMAAYRSVVQDYCANSTQVETTCMAWYDTQILVSDAEQAYRQLADQYSWDTYDDMWDWDTFYNLAWNMDDLMYHTYVSMDSFYIDLYQEAYNSIWNSLSTEQQAMYQDVMNLYETYDTIYYRDFTPLDHALMSDMDNYGNNLQSMMWNYWQNYQDFTWNLQSLQWQIVEIQDQMQREMEQHQMMLQVQAYFNTEAGLAKIKLLMITIYDMLDYAITNFDQDTFDMMFGLMTGQIQLTPEDLNSDNLVMAAGMAADLIDLLMATIDQDDIDNIASIAKDAAAMYVDTLDMTLLEGAALLLKINAAIDKYLNAAYDAVGEISSFLHSIDADKADAILAFVALMQSGTFNQNQIVIGVATLIDTLIADGSIDMEFVSGILVDLYFDVTTMLDPDPATVAAVKLALDANITRIFELAAEIALYDPSTFLSSEQMDSVAEFMARVEALVMMFDQGFETILDPISFGYDHQDFVNLIESMNDEYMNPEEIELQIDMFMAMFETEDEQFAYNMLLTIQSMVRALENIDSFTAFQNWFGAVVNLGFSNTAIANYMFNIGTWQLDVAINNPNGDVVYIQSVIDEETQYLLDYQGYAESLINFLEGLTLGMTPEQYNNSWTFWFAKLAYFEAQDAFYEAENEALWYIDYYAVDAMISAWDNYQFYTMIEDYVTADQMLTEFYSYYDYLDFYQQMLIDDLID
ncbi:MAG: hypothetical protein PHP32_06680, partial [Candidatus Izemoplasmatales bacterium]|nr:hypothetical protein [Candidatus Izemoplasmatales bacterium]